MIIVQVGFFNISFRQYGELPYQYIQNLSNHIE